MTLPPRQIWMDSGAFSAYGKEETLDVVDYGEWLIKHSKYIDHYAVLDDMRSASLTFDNQLAMEAVGLKPVPCFHFGEDISFLRKYLERGHDYIAIGGMVGKSRPLLREWLDGLWENWLTLPDGTPRLRVHGFGLTSFDLVNRYPWWSVDSSSWLFGSKAGTCLFNINGTWQRVEMDSESVNTANADGHYLTFPPQVRARLEVDVRARGFTPESLLADYWVRHRWNILAMKSFAAQWKCERWTPRQFSLVSTSAGDLPEHPPGHKHLSLFLAAEVGVREEAFMWEQQMSRMFSFYYLRKRATGPWKFAMDAIDGKPLVVPEVKRR